MALGEVRPRLVYLAELPDEGQAHIPDQEPPHVAAGPLGLFISQML